VRDRVGVTSSKGKGGSQSTSPDGKLTEDQMQSPSLKKQVSS